MTARSEMRRLANQVRTHGTDQAIREFAERAVSIALQKTKPRMSLAGMVRQHFSNEPALSERITGIAGRMIEASISKAAPVPTPSERWVQLEAAAEILGSSPGKIRSRLADVEYRRLHGWPWCDGRTWYFPAPALDPERRAAFVNAQPADEPFTMMPATKRVREG